MKEGTNGEEEYKLEQKKSLKGKETKLKDHSNGKGRR